MTAIRRVAPKRAARKRSDRRSTASPAFLSLIFTSLEGRTFPGVLTQQLTELRLEQKMQMPTQWFDPRSVPDQDRQHDDVPHRGSATIDSSELYTPADLAPAGPTRPGRRLRSLLRLPATALRPIERTVLLLLGWQERARERRHLLELSDHMLRDLGLSRADVENEVSKRFWRD